MQRLLQAAKCSGPAAQLACCTASARVRTAALATQAEQTPQEAIEVFVNGVSTQVAKGSTVLQACDAAGVDIPRLVLSNVSGFGADGR